MKIYEFQNVATKCYIRIRATSLEKAQETADAMLAKYVYVGEYPEIK